MGFESEVHGASHEQQIHINILELLAAHLAVKCFAIDKTNLTMYLKMDSMSALTYINKLGGTISPQLNCLAKTHQLPSYASWRPDPMAMTTDAFTMDWAHVRGYANPLWSLIGRVLAQSQQQEAELVLQLIASEPVWLAGCVHVYPACRNNILYCSQPAPKCDSQISQNLQTTFMDIIIGIPNWNSTTQYK